MRELRTGWCVKVKGRRGDEVARGRVREEGRRGEEEEVARGVEGERQVRERVMIADSRWAIRRPSLW